MRKFALTLAAAGLALGAVASTASAQTLSPAAANIRGQMENATPIVQQAACRFAGPHCGPGYIWRCGGVLGCRCVPCRR